MIAKTKEATPANNRFEQAGHAAEEQMAFYLRRDFGDTPDVYVFNDLRLTDGDDAAQMDHLVVHRYGMFIIESKSISGEVAVNRHDEWTRIRGNKREGMPSPIQQARRQRSFLVKLLERHSEQLLGKRLGFLQGHFGGCRIDVYVAISDRGIIKRQGADPPELCKADHVCDRIREEIRRHKKGSFLLSMPDGDYGQWALKRNELERIVAFVLEQHSPLRPGRTTESPPPKANARTAPPASPAAPAPVANDTAASAVCKHCGSDQLIATYGKYGYYFKCTACEKNTPIDYTCRQCRKKGRIRKQGPQFHRICKECATEQLVWRNPA